MENLNKEQLLERQEDLVWQLEMCQKELQRHVSELVECNIHMAKRVQETCECEAEAIVDIRTMLADVEQRIEAI